MARKNPLSANPPHAVRQLLADLGANLRNARLQRNLTLMDVAARIGTGRRAVQEAEKGKPSTSAAVYFALLSAYELFDRAKVLIEATAERHHGVRLNARERARPKRRLA